MDYLKLIDEKLAYHRQEIERLESSRAVIMDLTPEPTKKATSKQAVPQTVAKAKPKAAKPTGIPSKAVRARIAETLKDLEVPMTSGQLIEKLGLSENKQPVYTALNSMKGAGEVTKNEKSEYSLTKQG